MSDLEWVNFVAEFCLTRQIAYSSAIAKLTTSDYYQLAYRQFKFGADHRSIVRLLDQALRNTGLLDSQTPRVTTESIPADRKAHKPDQSTPKS